MDLDANVDTILGAIGPLVPALSRQLVAIAGPPASGKSTTAEKVLDRLVADGTQAALVPMDGFHLDNATLAAQGLSDRKGAPETFDTSGFAALLKRLRDGQAVDVPLFDRSADRVVPNARRISERQTLILVEGNYLFLKAPGWAELNRFWSMRIFLAPPLEVLEQRLIQRWLDEGLSPKAAKARATGNDLTNARLVLNQSDVSNVDLRLI